MISASSHADGIDAGAALDIFRRLAPCTTHTALFGTMAQLALTHAQARNACVLVLAAHGHHIAADAGAGHKVSADDWARLTDVASGMALGAAPGNPSVI